MKAKGKEYYFNGKPKFEGEYLKGKRWNGKGYNINDIVDLEIKDGKGKEYYDSKLKCSEEFKIGSEWIKNTDS